MNAVTGIGPRTGTSWVMGQLFKAGLPIQGYKFLPQYLVPEHNPDGYWELDPKEPIPTKGIVKLWNIWDKPAVNKVVLLKREDTKAQLASITKVLKDEAKLPNLSFLEKHNAKDILSYYVRSTDRWLETRDPTKTMLVYTETLNNKIDEIIQFFKEDN